jgi:hypothetical protein
MNEFRFGTLGHLRVCKKKKGTLENSALFLISKKASMTKPKVLAYNDENPLSK